jgi:nucleoside-diphosphate-sugar epimerase
MKIFITGGTGFIGSKLTEKLVSQEHEVILLLRDPSKAVSYKSDKIQYIRGDIFNKEALIKGMAGSDLVFHMAAYTRPGSADSSIPYKTNVTGTVNVLEAAAVCHVKKLVLTSTGGTMGCSKNDNPVNELTNSEPQFNTIYEKTKFEAERMALEYSARGLDIVIVNPTRVYGPGILSKSNSLTKLIKLYISGLWRILPGNGNSIGNYVYINDVVDGHILAALSGKNGERYILGGENLTFRELFDITGEVFGKKRVLLPLPSVIMKMIIKSALFISWVTGKPPFITSEWLDKYMNNWVMSSDKAVSELGYRITPFRTGVAETITWIKKVQQ